MTVRLEKQELVAHEKEGLIDQGAFHFQ